MSGVPVAPSEGEFTLQELYDRFVLAVTPPTSVLLEYHRLLVRYAASPEAVLILRAQDSSTRRQTILTHDGTRIRPSDNSPAWWMHQTAFQRREFNDLGDFSHALDSAPVHLFDVARLGGSGINRARWYVAHLIPAKQGRKKVVELCREEARGAFLRNVHPFNHFYLPMDARSYEADAGVLAFFLQQAQRRFGSAWEEFVSLSGAESRSWLQRLSAPDPTRIIRFCPKQATPALKDVVPMPGTHDIAVDYRKGRLWFMADLIEPLDMHERFRIRTPEGDFEMSKAEFYSVFDNVVRSDSYRHGRHYHYKSVPLKAMPYRVD